MTGDTLLKKRVRTLGRETFQDVAIVDIQKGDEILTLDEKYGRFVVAPVNALKDMGEKEIFEIITATGKKIRTTDTHPYLLAPDLSKYKPRVGVFIDSSNLYHAAKKAKWSIDLRNLKHILADAFDLAYAHCYIVMPREGDPTRAGMQTYAHVAAKSFEIKEKPLKYIFDSQLGKEVKKGDIDLEIAVDVVRVLSELDAVIIMSGDSDYLALAQYTHEKGVPTVFMSYKDGMAWELRLGNHLFIERVRGAIDRATKNPDLSAGAALTRSIVHKALVESSIAVDSAVRQGSPSKKAPEGADHNRLSPAFRMVQHVHPFVKGGLWTQAQKLREGNMVAVAAANGRPAYERIVEIGRRSAERVYDIEVEGTHNFIGNGIVAHNSNVADGFRFVLGEQSMKSMRGKRGEDMIWGGSPALPRMNRAAVKLVFDNSKKLLDIDFSEVVLERVVHRDGQNEYLLNGSQVRLKDVIRLLAGANIGGSGYQIISQGEADRILNASPRERREMVEDALGLKLYQHKKAESERKLEETAVNIEKTKSLRREIAPHLKFLLVQVEKIEKAREMKDELAAKLGEYLARENAFLTMESTRLHDELKEITDSIHDMESRLKEVQKAKGHKDDGERDELFKELEEVQGKLSDARRKREDIVRELGRAEGALEATNVTVESIVPVPHVREFAREITEAIEEAEHSNDISVLKNLLATLRNRIKSFVEGLSSTAPLTNKETKDAVSRLTIALKKAEDEEARLASETEKIRTEMTRVREASFAAEKDEVGIEAKLREAQTKMVALRAERDHVADQKRRYEEEVREGIAIAGLAMQGWDRTVVPEGALSEDRGEQEKRRRAIERLKIKIEEAGIGGGDAVVKEYKQTQDRDIFLGRELEDLEKSAKSLQDIIVELEKTIDARFTEGLKHINEALDGFFAKLFGGGHAKLFVEEPKRRASRRSLDALDVGDDLEDIAEQEEELYAGLSIDVSLPRKKIRGLEVLSGGERALTSIALIFSMSQVNPPPFLILDETDAALDEANSKRYADMIMELGKKSQLIVITHNRATMSAAGELYGVTMGQDGVSKVLSVKLEEAERVAK